MVNIWATWCGVCYNEMSQLEELSKELQGSDCQIIGICKDATEDDEAVIEEAKSILGENGVTFTNLVCTQGIIDQFICAGYPTTYFVDSEGKVLTIPVSGPDFDQYQSRIEEALAAVE